MAANALKQQFETQQKLAKIAGDSIHNFFAMRQEIGNRYVDEMAKLADSAWQVKDFRTAEDLFVNSWATTIRYLGEYYGKLWYNNANTYQDTIDAVTPQGK